MRIRKTPTSPFYHIPNHPKLFLLPSPLPYLPILSLLLPVNFTCCIMKGISTSPLLYSSSQLTFHSLPFSTPPFTGFPYLSYMLISPPGKITKISKSHLIAFSYLATSNSSLPYLYPYTFPSSSLFPSTPFTPANFTCRSVANCSTSYYV